MLEKLDEIAVVLVRPSLPENIGSAARACANMGIKDLRLAAPKDMNQDRMRALATVHGIPLLESMGVFDTLDEALADCNFAAGTTARQGRRRGVLASPRQAAAEILEWTGQGRVAVLFGSEDRGLSARELDRCRLSVCIPTTLASSLNLAQAVVVVGYELRMAALEADGRNSRRGPAPAPMSELNELFEHLKKAFVALNVIDAVNPDHFMRTMKAPLERAGMTPKEIRAWRGVGRQGLGAVERLNKALGKKD